MRQKGVELVGLEELFRESDAVSIHVPYSESTHLLVGAKLLSLMKPTAVVVNTSRGNIVDEDALYEVLASGKIGGAALTFLRKNRCRRTHPSSGWIISS